MYLKICDKCGKEERYTVYYDKKLKDWDYLDSASREIDLCPSCYKKWKKALEGYHKECDIIYEKIKKDFLG